MTTIKGAKNLLSITHPDLIKEWDYEKNYPLSPDCVVAGSHKKVYWNCSLGHSYCAAIEKRTSGRGCPYCAGKKILPGFNDLKTWCVKNNMIYLLDEWDYKQNGSTTPDIVAPHSNKEYYWLCPLGHSYKTMVNSRTGRDLNNCPYCSNHQVLEGFNDLKTWCGINRRINILDEWDYDKNIPITSVTAGSNKRVYWICPMGHSYESVIASRTGRNRGCPICAREYHTSFPEQALFYYVVNYFKDAVNLASNIIGIELDVFIPTKSIAIEYDGAFWHKTNKAELKKNLLCRNNNIRLIRVREEGLVMYDDCECITVKADPNYDDLTDVITKTLAMIDPLTDYDVNVERDFLSIYSLYVKGIKNNGLADRYPDIAKEWDFEKNSPITPDKVFSGSRHKYYWICSNGHSFSSSVAERTRNGGNDSRGCPYCSGKKVLRGFNDLKTRCPDIAKEWDYEKNIPITPEMIVSGSNKSFWWKCSKGHSYSAKVSFRTSPKSTGCPYCANHAVCRGFNDLETWCCANNKEYILKEWDYDKNKYPPNYYLAKSDKRVYWICSKGHSYYSKIGNRTRLGTGCLICANAKQMIKVMCVERNKIFDSIQDAEAETGAHHIGECCNGKRKTSGGYHWEYYDRE